MSGNKMSYKLESNWRDETSETYVLRLENFSMSTAQTKKKYETETQTAEKWDMMIIFFGAWKYISSCLEK